MIAKRTLIIINPISGTANKTLVENLIERHLPAEEFNYCIEYTIGPEHATQLAQTAANDGYDLVIAVGGDGTVSETAAGLIHSNTALGIFPIGSGNGLARHLQIPNNLVRAIKILSDSEVTKIDVCTANNLPFFNMAGMGYDAFIAHKFAKRGKRGFAAYIFNVLKYWFQYKPKKYKIKANGKTFKTKALMISVANGSQFGNNAWIAPKARINDGMLDVCILRKFPNIAAPLLALRLFNRSIDRSKYMDTFRSIDFSIRQNKKLVHLDGEPFKLGKKIHFKVLPKALNILAPKVFLHEFSTENSDSRSQ